MKLLGSVLGCKAGQIVILFADMAKKDGTRIILGSTYVPGMAQGDLNTLAVRVWGGPG